ncbi:MAG: metallophosphoesterase family protein [Mycobacterium leprae]
MRLAVFSDIHGNIQALSAVLADIAARGADVLWCGGDLVGYGANPGEVVDRIRSRGIPTAMGNYDDAIGYHRITCGCDYPDPAAHERGLQSVAWTKAHTTDEQKQYLRSLPYRLQREFGGRQVVLVHGSPARLNEYLTTQVTDEVLDGYLRGTGADVLICCHTHKPYCRNVGSGLVVNAGSAGRPKHGKPVATYVLLDLLPERVDVTVVEVAYDYEAAARAIEEAGLPAPFAQQLRDGRG